MITIYSITIWKYKFYINFLFCLKGYSTVLRTLTSGNATFSLELSSYEPMNTQDQNTLLNKMAGLA